MDLGRYRSKKDSPLEVQLDRLGVGHESIRRPRRQFLKGPIPADWLSAAGNLPGKTLHVGICLWYASGVIRERKFSFSRQWRQWFELSATTVRKSLGRLQSAGLVGLENQPGRAPVVTILDAPKQQDDCVKK